MVNIGIKSGTDDIHGSAYYFHRNEAFDARNYFDHTTDPVTGAESKAAALLLHQFGASIGGPILKGKWFYFANYEGVRSKVGSPWFTFVPVTTSLATADNPEGDPFLSVPDALRSTGCDQQPLPEGCSQLSQNLVKFLPFNPGFTADPDDPSIINFNFNNVNRADNVVFKSDFHANDHHVFTGRYIYANTNQNEMDGIALRPEWLSHAAPITQVFGLDWTWTPNSRWVNTARFSFNSFWEKIAPLDANVNPTDYGLNTRNYRSSPLWVPYDQPRFRLVRLYGRCQELAGMDVAEPHVQLFGLSFVYQRATRDSLRWGLQRWGCGLLTCP